MKRKIREQRGRRINSLRDHKKMIRRKMRAKTREVMDQIRIFQDFSGDQDFNIRSYGRHEAGCLYD